MKRLTVGLLILIVMTWSTQAMAEIQKNVSMWVTRDVAPGSRIGVTINTTNIRIVTMFAYKLRDPMLLLGEDMTGRRAIPSGKPVKTWSVNVAKPKEVLSNQQKDVYRSRQVNLPQLPSGAYLLVARSEDKEARAMVNVTNLSVVLKQSNTQLLAWVTDFTSGVPVSDAKIQLYKITRKSDKAPQIDRVATSDTKVDGTALIKSPPSQSQAIIITHGSDIAVMTAGRSIEAEHMVAHIQMDRPVYRAGQKVYYKAILRRTKGTRYEPIANSEATVEIRDPYDNIIDEQKIKSNAIGTIAGEYDIPSEAQDGAHSIVVKVGNESAYETLTVAAYRKPDFKVNVKPERTRIISGENLSFNVQATYYFGAPVQEGVVEYVVRRNDNYYSDYSPEPEWNASDDGNIYPHDIYSSGEVVASGTIQSDKEGNASIAVKTSKVAPDSNYVITCTVRDSSRRQVEGSSSATVYAAGIRIGISTKATTVPIGSKIPLNISVIDIDGRPAAARVTLTLQSAFWDKAKKQYVDNVWATTDVNVPASGKAFAEMPAKTDGSVTIIANATDKLGHITKSYCWLWVAPTTTIKKTPENKEPWISVKSAKSHYYPGEKAQAYVTTNTSDRPVLVVVEGSEIWQYEVLLPGKPIHPIEVNATTKMSPSIYINAYQLSKSARVSSTAMIPIPDRSLKLEVTITPEQKVYRPGDRAKYTIRTTDYQGKPVSAEVSVAVVDESVYAVRPDCTPKLYQTFWANRENDVSTYVSAPEEISGGAGQGGSPSVAPLRQRFVDTAFWNARVMTGPDGTASVSFETPGNLTTWRASARAVTADTAVGEATIKTEASRPVMLRLATPRQFVVGDRLTLISTLTNRADTAHEFDCTISAQGVTVDGEISKRIIIPAKGSKTIEWPVSVTELPVSGTASIICKALATDATRETASDLSDQLESTVRIAPKGLQEQLAVGGAMSREKTATLDLPDDRIEPASVVTVTLRNGYGEIADDMIKDVISHGRYSSLGAADTITVASVAGPRTDIDMKRQVIEASLVLKYRCYGGLWGRWGREESDPVISAAIITAGARARNNHLALSRDFIDSSTVWSAIRVSGQQGLWENAVQLISATALIDHKAATKQLEKVHGDSSIVSPFANLALAEAYFRAGKKDWADATLKKALKYAVIETDTAYIPGGDRREWRSTTVEATAQALTVLVEMSKDSELQSKLAQWLAKSYQTDYMSQHEMALSAYALKLYTRKHPQAATIGKVELMVNGTPVEVKQGTARPLMVYVPSRLLKSGANSFTIKRDIGGEIFYSIDATIFRPTVTEAWNGVRILRRYDVLNKIGLWEEMKGSIEPSQSVRCTVVVWPGDTPDDIKVIEPIPSGFEFVDSEVSDYCNREDVRDGEVVHYMRAEGVPMTFRYYLRPESEGKTTAMPAVGAAIDRPAVKGNSPAQSFEVKE